MQRILHKSPAGLFNIVIISQRQCRTTNTDLPDPVCLCYQTAFIIYQKYLFVIKGRPDRYSLLICPVSVDHMVCTVAGNLRRSVQIDKHSLRQVLHPVLQLFFRHHFSAEHHLSHRVWAAIIQTVKHTDKTQCRYCPDHSGDLMFTQIIQKLCRTGKQLSWHDQQFSPCFQCRIDILYRYVEIKGCLIRNTLTAVQGKSLRKNINKIKDRAVADHHTLWYSCRTGGEVDIQRIHIRLLSSHLFQICRIFTALHQFFYAETGDTGKMCPCRFHMFAVRQYHRRFQYRCHHFKSAHRQFRIKIRIKTSGIHNTEKREHRILSLGHEHRRCLPWF